MKSRKIVQPQKTFLICASPRSGSTLLCEVLFRSGLLGKPREVFNPDLEAGEAEAWGTTTYAEFYQRAIADGMGPDGVFGTKLMWMYMERVTEKLQTLFGPHPSPLARVAERFGVLLPGINGRKAERDPHEALKQMAQVFSSAFPNLHYIWITRRNKVRQAVSLHRALQTDVWVQTEDVPPPAATQPVFDFERVDGLLHNVILANDAGWQQFFEVNGIQPLHVEYSDLVADNVGVARRVLSHLDVPMPSGHQLAPPILRKQSDALSEQWVQRYQHIAAESNGTKREPLLA